MNVEEKWKANQAKVAFMKAFPGLILAWDKLAGKTVELTAPLPSRLGGVVLVFDDGSFVVAPPLSPEPWELTEALAAARPALEPAHRDAYAEYDRLARLDKEALRSARLEKILGAIQNNLEQIPELKDRLKDLVRQWK